MPLKGRQRTGRQKAHTAAMQKRRWLLRSPARPGSEVINPTHRRLVSSIEKKHAREMEKVEKSEHNARRREQRLREELKESQAQTQEVTNAAEERYEEQFEEWRREKEGLKKDIARHNARDRREPSRIQHAVREALKHPADPNTVQPSVRYVKGKRGIIQNWARDAIVTLVNEGIPMSKTWSVTKANAKALGVTIVGKWSFRTSRRVVREGGIAAGLMILQYILTCVGL